MKLYINESNVYEIAATVFDGTKWEASEDDIKLLVHNMLILEKKGLSDLNKRLVEGGKKVWDTFAEHNFANELLKYHKGNAIIDYEPVEDSSMGKISRPVDFRVCFNGIKYWLQMKKISLSERENRQRNAIDSIKNKLKNVELNRFYWIDYDKDFGAKDVAQVVDFIKMIAPNSVENKKYSYKVSGVVRIQVSLWKPKKSVFSHLTPAGAGNIECVETTGEDSTQIKNSLIKAAGAFSWKTDSKNINLIVMEADNHYNIDLSEALYGQEIHVHSINNRFWHRNNDGFFYMPEVSDNIAGVIVVRRKDKYSPVCDYNKILFINDRFIDKLEQINDLIDFSKIVQFNELINDDKA